MTDEQLQAIRARFDSGLSLEYDETEALLAEVERLQRALNAYGIDHRLGWDECRACRQRNEHRENQALRQKNYHLASCVFYSLLAPKDTK